MGSFIFLNATLEQKWPQCKANGDFNVHYRKTSAGGSDFELLICFSNIGRTDSQGKVFCILFSFRLSFIWLKSVFILSLKHNAKDKE